MSLPFISLGIGLSFTLIALCEFWNQWGKTPVFTRIFGTLETIGRHALYLFVFHYLFVALPLHATGLAGTLDATHTVIGATAFSLGLGVIGIRAGLPSREVYNRFDMLWRQTLALLRRGISTTLPSSSRETRRMISSNRKPATKDSLLFGSPASGRGRDPMSRQLFS